MRRYAYRGRQLAVLYRTLGPRKFLMRLVRRTGALVYARRVELLLEKSLDTPPRVDPTATELEIDPIAPRHAWLLRRFNRQYRSPSKVIACDNYLRNGYAGFVAFLGDDLIGYWWWVSNATPPERHHPCVTRFGLHLADDEVFAFDYFVAPEARQKGAGVRFLALIYEALATQGYRGVWGSVDADNVAARWVYATLGNKVVRRMMRYDLFSTFLLQDTRVFIRNTRWRSPHTFEHRPLFALPLKKHARDSVLPAPSRG